MSCMADNGKWYPIVATETAIGFDILPTTNEYYTNLDDLIAKNLTFDEKTVFLEMAYAPVSSLLIVSFLDHLLRYNKVQRFT